MFGFLLGVFAVVAGRHFYRRCHGRGHAFGHGHGRWGYDSGRPYYLRWLSRKLRLTLAQEKATDEILRETVEKLSSLKRTFRDGLADVARGLSGAEEADLTGVWASQDEALAEARAQVRVGLQRLREVLDPTQREVLAELLECGQHSCGWRGCRASLGRC
ncbi:MAG: hypothetical protein H6729_05585 [Deltaproteobacteria bacterium]|nr:hypothetical protein [Deltaproteobacteria bacterium]